MAEDSFKLDRILRVDLSKSSVESEEMDNEAVSFIGGKGLAAYYLNKELKSGIDPISKDNKLIFAWGPLTGLAPGSSRYTVATKSPLTGAFLDAYSGGFFPAKLRFALPGYAAIIFEGKSDDLVYLHVGDGEAELRNASDYTGKSIGDIQKELDSGFEVAGIGIAGENMVEYATISSDKGAHHAGRGGAGAVMGSKNLKFIAVKSKKPNITEKIKELSSKYSKILLDHPGTQWAIDAGTATTLRDVHNSGIMPTEGFKKGRNENYDDFGLEKVKEVTKGRKACYNCPLACGYSLEIDGFKTLKGPEFESIVMLGSNCGVSDLKCIAELDALCNEYGIDTIQTGNTIGWLMRSSEEGVVDYEVEFGDVEKIKKMIVEIANRSSEMGNILAGDFKSIVDFYGGEEYAAECKGMGYSGYDPRGSVGMALAFATSDRGACHKRSWTVGPTTFWGNSERDFEAQHEVVKADHDNNSLLWSLVLCDFVAPAYIEDLGKEWLETVGYNFTIDQLKSKGEEIWEMTRKFNVREGFSRVDDNLPKIMTKPLAGDGPTSGYRITQEDFDKMLDLYYTSRGWDKNGEPD